MKLATLSSEVLGCVNKNLAYNSLALIATWNLVLQTAHRLVRLIRADQLLHSLAFIPLHSPLVQTSPCILTLSRCFKMLQGTYDFFRFTSFPYTYIYKYLYFYMHIYIYIYTTVFDLTCANRLIMLSCLLSNNGCAPWHCLQLMTHQHSKAY